MGRAGFRVNYSTKGGWRFEDHDGRPLDASELFARARSLLDRFESAVTATEQPGGDESSEARESSMRGAPPGDVEAVPDDPLEPSVPALAIRFEPPDDLDPAGLPPTRFGGQPEWLEDAAWPLSRTLGTPMEFEAQIALHPSQLPWLAEPRMVYLFSTDDREDPGGPATWEPFAGENAVIVQPGALPSWVDLRSMVTGPTVGAPVEVTLVPTADPALLDDGQMAALRRIDPDLADRYCAAIDYDKIGGTPNFFQGLELPDFDTLSTSRRPDAAVPIMMIRSAEPTRMNLGDAGRAVTFLSPDQRQGAHLWF